MSRRRRDDTLLSELDPLDLIAHMEGGYRPKREGPVNKRVTQMHNDLKAKERAMKKRDEE